jgi:hypothetical protein
VSKTPIVLDPNFAVIRGEAEFQAMVDELDSDMADQLSRL